jgi:nucleoside-diphosphate-sugar epimerase
VRPDREEGERKVTTIAITGVGGLIGRQLVAALDDRDDVERIVGIDVRAPQGLTSPRLVFRELDIRGAELVDALHGVDVLVHLAFQMDPHRDESVMRSINLDGTRNVFEAALRAGVGHVVYPSSVAVYGAHPDNDFPLTERSRLRPTPGMPYSEHKWEVEHWLLPWLEEHSELPVAVLRVAMVLGTGVENFMTRTFELPRFPLVRGHKPPLQFVHVDDVIGAILHTVEQRLTGVYNVCAEGWLSYDEVMAIVGRRPLEVPEEVAFSTADRAWAFHVSDIPSGVVAHTMHPWVMSADALIATGWRPRRTNRDAVAEAARDHAPYVSLGRGRVRRSTVRWAGLLGAAGTVTGALAALRGRRRRRAAGAAHADADTVARRGSGRSAP